MIGLRAGVLTLGLAASLLALPVLADDVTDSERNDAVLRPNPERLGYAFDRPAILLRQRLFGMAHGIMLLVSACIGKPSHAEIAQSAFDVWHAKQQDALLAMKSDLAFFYFGERAAESGWQDVASAIGLAEALRPNLGDVKLEDACRTLPEAIAQPRYDLAHLLALEHAAVTSSGHLWPDGLPVSPAPTFNPPQEAPVNE